MYYASPGGAAPRVAAGPVRTPAFSPAPRVVAASPTRAVYKRPVAAGNVPAVKPAVVQRPAQAPQVTSPAFAVVSKAENLRKVLELLEDHGKRLKEVVAECFGELWQPHEPLKKQQLSGFTTSIAKKVGLPISAFRYSSDDFERFDFNGDNSLQEHEAYRLMKYQLRRYRKEMGCTSDEVGVPFKTLEAEGLEIVRELGKGNQGSALLAKNQAGEDVCIKKLPRSNQNVAILGELKDEFTMLSSLHSDHVAKVFDIFQDATSYYLIQEPYFGDDLAHLRENAASSGVAMTEEWWRDIFKQCFEGIAYMHKHAVMHCDIKEGNMMIKSADIQRPEVVIIDFGIAQNFVQPKYDQLRGTPGYLPPETWRDKKWYPKGDAFSMGVTAMQLVLNSTPQEGPAGVVGGVFCDGAKSVEDVERFTLTRQPPLQRLRPQMNLLADLLGCLLCKEMHSRIGARQALDHPWFTGDLPQPQAAPTAPAQPLQMPAAAPKIAKSPAANITPSAKMPAVAKVQRNTPMSPVRIGNGGPNGAQVTPRRRASTSDARLVVSISQPALKMAAPLPVHIYKPASPAPAVGAVRCGPQVRNASATHRVARQSLA